MPRKILLILIFSFLLAGCEVNHPKNPYAEIFEAERIRSILVLPAVNNSLDVDAPWVLLSTLPEYLGESGYYVFPTNTVKVVLEHEGLYEAAETHALPPPKLANLFDADSVLYITIEEWESQYIVISTTTKITLSYRLVSRSGLELWSAKKTVVEQSEDSSGTGSFLAELIVEAVSAAVQRAAPNYRPLALKANQELFSSEYTQWPDGPYRIEKEQEKNKGSL